MPFVKDVFDSGVSVIVHKVGNAIGLRTSTMPYTHDIVEGIEGYSAVRRFGLNPSVGVTIETVHNVSDLKTYLTSAERLQVTSDDADDDGDPVGNGARTVKITGLDTDYVAIEEVVTLNGVANVLTDASFLRVLLINVVSAGSTGYNEGTITVSNNADTAVLAQIQPMECESHGAYYTVPAGYTAYIIQVIATEASSKGSAFGFWLRTFEGLWTKKRGIVLLDNNIVLPAPMHLKIPEKTDLEVRAIGILAGAYVTAGFEGWIEEN